ncbi:MAG: tetratricopeptide repeat protein [Pirellulales bacterium]
MSMLIVRAPILALLHGTDRNDSPEVFHYLHGMFSEDSCLEEVDEDLLDPSILGGGQVRLVHDEATGLWATTAYQMTQRPDATLVQQLKELTLRAWQGDVGQGPFMSFRGHVLSKSLYLEAQQFFDEESDLGELCIEIPEELTVDDLTTEWFENGEPIDLLIQDLEQGVAEGDPEAQFELGRTYDEGDGVEIDLTRAAELYRQAADQHHPLAATFLGIAYQSGRGVETDLEKAVPYFDIGIDGEHPLALYCKAECLLNGWGIAEDPSQAVSLLQRGADVGDAICLFRLAECYELGLGVNADLDRALSLYIECQELGYEDPDRVEHAIQRCESQLESP